MSTPSDEALLKAITQLRPLNPHLGRAKFLSLLKEGNEDWILSEKRLKKVLDDNDINATTEHEEV